MKRNSRTIRNIHRSSASFSSSTSFTSSNLGRCGFYSTDNRRCRNPRWDAHPALCLYHARRERLILDAERVAAELAPISGEFKTFTDLNLALGKLFRLLAADRLPSRKAAVLAYLGQLLLHSLPGVRREVNEVRGYDAWRQIVRRSLPIPAAPLPPAGAEPTH